MYQEPGLSHFTHNKRKYDLNKLFSLIENKVSINIPIEKVKWILEHTAIKLANGDMTCSSCNNKYNDDSSLFHTKRVNKADISIPIIIINEDNRLVTVDGIHRLEKAIREKNISILSVQVAQKELDLVEIK